MVNRAELSFEIGDSGFGRRSGDTAGYEGYFATG